MSISDDGTPVKLWLQNTNQFSSVYSLNGELTKRNHT